tara:strand:- start:272 stop:415 length:144 start_codon:yes stop_codon:yes gene_type:complete
MVRVRVTASSYLTSISSKVPTPCSAISSIWSNAKSTWGKVGVGDEKQ